jgi:hypothetical protein
MLGVIAGITLMLGVGTVAVVAVGRYRPQIVTAATRSCDNRPDGGPASDLFCSGEEDAVPESMKRAALIVVALAALVAGSAALAFAQSGGGTTPQGSGTPSAVENDDRDDDADDADERDDDDGVNERDDDVNEPDDADAAPPAVDAARAREAAVAAARGGRAEDVEVEDEPGVRYEVEVRKPDGSTVEVELDERFEVVTADADD